MTRSKHHSTLLWPGALVPATLAILCAAVGLLLPDDTQGTAEAATILLTVARYLLLLYVPWALWVMLRTHRVLVPLLVGALGFLAAGIPGLDQQRPIRGLRVAWANVLYKGQPSEAQARALANLEPDVLVTLEREMADIPTLQSVARYDGDEPWRAMRVYCKQGACQATIEPHGTSACPMPVAVVRHASGLCVIGLHVPPPQTPGCPSAREPYTDQVTAHVDDGRLADAWGPCQAGDPAMIGGDFNAAPWQAPYRAVKSAGFRDPFFGAGIFARTFPAGGDKWDVPVTRIDFGLAGDVDVEGVDLVDIPNTDHKAVLVGVIPESAPRAEWASREGAL